MSMMGNIGAECVAKEIRQEITDQINVVKDGQVEYTRAQVITMLEHLLKYCKDIEQTAKGGWY